MEYCISDDGERFSGSYRSVDDAVAAAADEFEDAEVVFVGESTRKTIGGYFSVRHVQTLLEQLAEDAGEECGEVTDGWLAPPRPPFVGRFATAEEKAEFNRRRADFYGQLRDDICAALEKWATENGQQPSFWHVSNVTEHRVARVKKEGASCDIS